VRGEGATRVKARRWRAKGEPIELSCFHSFLGVRSRDCL
jgi:hypothetical protein